MAKVSNNWRLNKILQRIKTNIESMEGLHFYTIRRERNKLAERLANEGTASNLKWRSRSWHDLEEGDLHQHCHVINANDNRKNEQSLFENPQSPMTIQGIWRTVVLTIICPRTSFVQQSCFITLPWLHSPARSLHFFPIGTMRYPLHHLPIVPPTLHLLSPSFCSSSPLLLLAIVLKNS